MGEKYGKDSAWESMLEAEILNTNVNIEAVLNQKMANFHDIMHLKVGSTILMNNEPEDEIILRCGTTKMFSGKLGRLGKKIAVMINNMKNKKIRE